MDDGRSNGRELQKSMLAVIWRLNKNNNSFMIIGYLDGYNDDDGSGMSVCFSVFHVSL